MQMTNKSDEVSPQSPCGIYDSKIIALKLLCNLLHSNKSTSNCEQHRWNLLKYDRTYIYRNIKLAHLWYNLGLSSTKINKQPNDRKLPLDLRRESRPSVSSFYVINWKLLSASLLGNDIYEIVFLIKVHSNNQPNGKKLSIGIVLIEQIYVYFNYFLFV